MIHAFYGPFGDHVVITVPREELLELHGALVQSDGRSETADRLLSILEMAIAGGSLSLFDAPVHINQLPLG